MDNLVAGECSAAEEVRGSQVASGPTLTDSNAAIATAAASARASVVASAASAMTALVAAAAISLSSPPFHAHLTPGSTFIRDIPRRGIRRSAASSAASGLSGRVSSLFLGHAPWPKEGPWDVEEEGNSGSNKPTPAGCDADRAAPSRRRNDCVDSHEGTEGKREIEKGARASKTAREIRTKKGGNSRSQRPGLKTEDNRRTRALKRASSKVGRKPGAGNDADAAAPPAKLESGTSASISTSDVGPQGGGAPSVGLSADRASTERVFRRTVSSCEHSDAPHYGKGFCRPCYMREYNKAKKRGEKAVRLPAPSRVLVSYGSREAKGSSSSVGATGTATGAAAARPATTTTSLLTRGQSAAAPKKTAISPPLCAECGQTEKSGPLVLICDGCEATFHLGCQGRINQPVGEWFCLRCTAILRNSDSESEIKTGDPAAGRNSADPASTKACTRSTAPAQCGDATNPGYDTRAAAPETKTSRSGSGESAKEGLISRGSLDGGVDGASSAKERQARCNLKGVVRGCRCPTKGDVRGCRCPTCVSLLLQSGGTRPSEAKKTVVPGEIGDATSISAPTVVVTGPRKVGSSSAAASDAPTTSIQVTKRRRQRSSKPSPAPEAVSAAIGRRSNSADGGISGTNTAQGARSALYSRVVVQVGSAPVLSTNNTSSSSSSANASFVSASSTSASAANALSTKIQSSRASLGKAPLKDASSAANASSRGNVAPISDAREGLRPSRAGRKRCHDDEEVKGESCNSKGEAEIAGARCVKGKGKGGAACSDDGSYFMSSDDNGNDENASEEGGAPRGRKRAGRTKKRKTAPHADASGSTVVRDGDPKGAITVCEHTNRPLYLKGLCKQCYMVNYWDRRHATIGIKPRSPRSSLEPQKKNNKTRAQDMASQNALSFSYPPICASSTTGAAVPVAAAAAADSERGRPLTGQRVAVKPATSIGRRVIAGLVTTAGLKNNGVPHDTGAAAARPSGARILIPKTVIRSMALGATRLAKPLKKTHPENLSTPLKGPPSRAGQGAGDAQVAIKKRPRSAHESEPPETGTKSVPASSEHQLGRGSGDGGGAFITSIKRIKMSAPREPLLVPARAVSTPKKSEM